MMNRLAEPALEQPSPSQNLKSSNGLDANFSGIPIRIRSKVNKTISSQTRNGIIHVVSEPPQLQNVPKKCLNEHKCAGPTSSKACDCTMHILQSKSDVPSLQAWRNEFCWAPCPLCQTVGPKWYTTKLSLKQHRTRLVML
eukprot:2407479-Amphidinium_carterae.2